MLFSAPNVMTIVRFSRKITKSLLRNPRKSEEVLFILPKYLKAFVMTSYLYCVSLIKNDVREIERKWKVYSKNLCDAFK